MSNISSLKMQAEMLLSKMTGGKRYVLGDINARLQEAANNYPQDTVIKAVASVIEQLHNKDPNRLVSQGDVEKLYNELVGLNVTGTKFREVLGDLLLSERKASVSENPEYISRMRDGEAESFEYDRILEFIQAAQELKNDE